MRVIDLLNRRLSDKAWAVESERIEDCDPSWFSFRDRHGVVKRACREALRFLSPSVIEYYDGEQAKELLSMLFCTVEKEFLPRDEASRLGKPATTL